MDSVRVQLFAFGAGLDSVSCVWVVRVQLFAFGAGLDSVSCVWVVRVQLFAFGAGLTRQVFGCLKIELSHTNPLRKQTAAHTHEPAPKANSCTRTRTYRGACVLVGVRLFVNRAEPPEPALKANSCTRTRTHTRTRTRACGHRHR